MEKARLFRISMTMACRAVAGVGARKILVSTQKGPSSKHTHSTQHTRGQARTDKIKFLSLLTSDQRHHTMDVITTIDYLRYSYCFVEVTWQEARFDAGLVV